MAEIFGQVTRSDIVGYSCDACGKEASYMQHVDAWHDSWGNDSCDSQNRFHYCSPKCLKNIIVDKFIKSEFYSGYESSKLNYIGMDEWKFLLGLD